MLYVSDVMMIGLLSGAVMFFLKQENNTVLAYGFLILEISTFVTICAAGAVFFNKKPNELLFSITVCFIPVLGVLFASAFTMLLDLEKSGCNIGDYPIIEILEKYRKF